MGGSLFTPPGDFSGSYTVASVVDADTFTISVPGGANQSAAAGFMADSASTTTGWLDRVYANTTFTAPAGRVGVLGGGPTNSNNGIWGSGTPDPVLIGNDTFSIRWTGQVQPQFSEEYTFIVHSDDGCRLTINGQLQELKTLPSTNSGGGTYSYDTATGDTVVTYTNSLVPAGSFVVGETVRLDPSSGNLTHATGSTYSYDSETGDAVIDYSNLVNVAPGGFAVGQTVEVDPTTGPVNLGQLPYVITAATASTFTVNFEPGTFATGAGNINISDNLDLVISAVTDTTYTVDFGAGKYATGTGSMSMNIINKPLKDWASMGNERFVRIPMVGGVRYDIQLEYYENTGYSRCRFFWYSPSQPKQIIPSERLYPSDGTLAPAAHITETEATALVGGSFSVAVAGSNGASVSLSGNPAWLSYSDGILSGTPPGGAAGDFQILITITNAAGTSTSVLNLHVEDTGGTIVREYWAGVPGTTIADIPASTTPSGSGNLTSLEAPTDFGDDYGARIRGYITAPATGNYYFWIAASNAAELWISNDDEPVNAFKRGRSGS